MDLDQLTAKMMKLVMTQSGATKMFLLMMQEDSWFVQARSDAETGQHDTNINEPYDPAESEDGSVRRRDCTDTENQIAGLHPDSDQGGIKGDDLFGKSST
jgi:hypothetical protein